MSHTYTPAELAYLRDEFADTEWMVHVAGPDDVLLYSDINDDDPDYEPTVPFTLATADQMANNINSVYERLQIEDPSPLNPMLHATVFHFGRPLADPTDVPAAPKLTLDEREYFRGQYGQTEWAVYVHGMDETLDRREGDEQPFSEEGARRYVADMALWDREHVAQGLEATPTTLLRYGLPADEWTDEDETDDEPQYEPDPQLVRAIAERIIQIEIDEIRALSGVDIAEMCETERAAVAAAIRPGQDREEVEDALIEAIRLEIRAAVLAPSWLTGVGVGSVSPTDPIELGAWLRDRPQGTILRDRAEHAWQIGEGIETSGEGERWFRALLPAIGEDPIEITEGCDTDEERDALTALAALAPLTVLALGTGTTHTEAGA